MLFISLKKQNGLIRKIKLILNFMTSQPGQQTIVIHTLVSISRSKANQTRKYGELIEFNMRNIFLEKSYTKCDRESFSEKLKLSISLNQQSKVLQSLFSLYAKLRAIETLNLSCRPLSLPHIKLFPVSLTRFPLNF